MTKAGPLKASLVMMFLALTGAQSGVSAGPPKNAACARTAPYACAARWSHLRPKRHYRGDEGMVIQLSPRLSPRRISRLRFDHNGGEACPRSVLAKGGCPDQRDLAEALIRPPSPATEVILREHGIPIIPGVPPVAILRSDGDGAEAGTSLLDSWR